MNLVKKFSIFFIAASFLFASCEAYNNSNKTQRAAVIGGVAGGILGAILGFKVLQFSQVKSPMGRGISLGTASHALGIMAAFNLSEKHAIYASLGMIFNGVFTAILAPIIMPYILM